MKREFGKKLIEQFLPTVNLDGVVNTSGAYIPGHGTPTVLLFGSNEPRQGDDVLTVLAKRGEPSTPEDPERGQVWRSIEDHGAEIGFEDDYVSVARVARPTLEKHPWSLGGGGASELKELLEERAAFRLGDLASIGVGGMSNADDVYIADLGTWRRFGMPEQHVRELVIGEEIRDWAHEPSIEVYFPYSANLELEKPRDRELALLWPYRTTLAARAVFGGGTYKTAGRTWWEWHQLTKERYRIPLSIVFAEVATHNHFVFDRGGKIFNRTAPIIKLKESATEEKYLALLAYLNSSTVAFYNRQVLHCKGAQGVNEGHKSEEWEQFLEHNGTGVGRIPVPHEWQSLAPLAREMLHLARERFDASAPAVVLRARTVSPESADATEASRHIRKSECLVRMVALQERIDFEVYRLFGLIEAAPPRIDALAPGARPFEVQLVRDATPTAWFARHGYQVPNGSGTGLSALGLPAEVLLIEQPTYKRRWLLPDPKQALEDAVYIALQDLLEERLRVSNDILSVRQMDHLARTDDVKRIGALAMGADCDPRNFIADFLSREAVPFVAAYRLSASGLEKRAAWERVWELQRAEDRGEKVPPFDPPPKYDRKDYRDATYWRLRGKLDVPKERFISYPGCESDEDNEPVYGWAGWNHLNHRARSSITQRSEWK